MDLGCQVGNSEWHLVGLPKDGREVGATGKHVDLGLRGRQALTLPAPSHDFRESVGGLPFPPSPCHGHDMAFFLDQNGYCPLSNLNCVGQGGDRRRLFRRGSAFLSKNSHAQFAFSATPPSSSLAIFSLFHQTRTASRATFWTPSTINIQARLDSHKLPPGPQTPPPLPRSQPWIGFRTMSSTRLSDISQRAAAAEIGTPSTSRASVTWAHVLSDLRLLPRSANAFRDASSRTHSVNFTWMRPSLRTATFQTS